ncbi:MAG: hypothetical protein R2772_03285 [Chitinophagales bacterium]
MKHIAFYIVLILFAFSSCKEASFRDEADFGYSYIPKELDYWQEFEVDSIYYDDLSSPSTIDTTHFYIREYYESNFLDASGKENIRVEQYRKQNLSDSWSLYQVGSILINSNGFQRYFKDLRFLNLVFPVREGLEWQGHAYIDAFEEASLEYLDPNRFDWSYEYSEVNIPYNNSNFSFDSCLLVLQIDEENLFEKKYAKEIYARGVGLVEKEVMILETQAPPSAASFLERAESGFIYKQSLIDYKH